MMLGTTNIKFSAWAKEKRMAEGICVLKFTFYIKVTGVQLKSGPYFNISNLFTKIYNILYYTTNLYLQ